MQLVSGERRLDLSAPVVMGIVNLTPDSFADGGRSASPDAGVEHALQMVASGAAIIDLGAESTRPGARPVAAGEQLDRLMPVLEALRPATEAFISVDTASAAVIAAVAAAGADMINDVFALRQEGALSAAAGTGCAVCLMHMQGVPADMQDNPRYDDVTLDVMRFLRERLDACRAAGISGDRLVVDPGFGFGKTDAHNMALLDHLGRFREFGLPVLAGLSRKGSLGTLTGRPVNERLAASLAAAVLAVERGARIVRTHDVPETVDALKIVAAVNQAGSGMGVGPAG